MNATDFSPAQAVYRAAPCGKSIHMGFTLSLIKCCVTSLCDKGCSFGWGHVLYLYADNQDRSNLTRTPRGQQCRPMLWNCHIDV